MSYCIEINCLTSAVFNYPNKIKALYCNKHKKENMTNIISRRCDYFGCLTQPNFNYPNKKKLFIVKNIKKKK
jgi:hypothetical protein